MQRAVNPQTGEVLFLVNNQWMSPAQTARNPQTGQMAYLVNNEWQIEDSPTREVSTLFGVSAKEFAEAAVPEFDVVKRGLSSAIQGITGAPAGIEAAVRAPVRQVMGEGLLEQSELYQLGRRLFGREPTSEEIEQTKARKIEADRAINQSIPLIPGLQELAEGGRDIADFIRERQSPEALEAVRGSEIQGNILEAVKTGDYSKLSFGENPTLYGYALQAADVLGSLLPVVIAGAVGPISAGAVGGGMAAGEAAQNAKEYVNSKSDVELAAASPYYKDLIAAGVPAQEARQIISNRAAEQAAFLQGTVATIGGVATQKIVSGAADKVINAAGRQKLTRIAIGGALAGAEEGVQEFLEGVAADIGISKEVIKEIGEDSFANLVLGFIGGAPVGMIRGALPDQPTTPSAQPPTPASLPTAAAPTTAPSTIPPTAPPTAASTPTPPGAPPAGVSPVIPMNPGPGLLGGYVDAGNNTEVRIVPAPDGKFQVIYVDTNTGQTSDAGTFDDFDGANSTAAMLVGVNPATFAPSALTPPAGTTTPPPSTEITTPPTAPTTPPVGITPTPPTGVPPTPPATPSGVPPQIKPTEFTPEEQQALDNYFQGQIPNAQTVFQNRDRSGKGSIAQMQKIASAPDYSLVGPSKVLAEGAPVIISDINIPTELLGRTDMATASNGQRFPVRYAVVPATEVLTSNLADGTVNTNYGDMSIPGMRAIAGNGRIAGIQEAYNRNTTENYLNELISDSSHGVDPQVISSIPNPVLVRIMPKGLVPENIGDLSNVSGIAGLEPVDRAKNDLKRLAGKFDLTGLQFTEEGVPQLSTLRQFIQAMPESEQSELINKATGLPNPDASSRLMNAIFYGAYENDALIDLYAATTNPDAKMYLNSLARVAPKMVKLAGTGDYDIRPKVVEGIENLVSAVRQGIPIKEMPTFVKQGAIGLDPYAQKVMEFIAESGRSTKRISDGLSRLADAALEASQISTEPDMFGETPPRPTLNQVFESLKEIEQEPDLFGEPTTEVKPPEPLAPPEEVKFDIAKTSPQIYQEIKNLDVVGLAEWAKDNAPNELAKEVASKIESRLKDFASRGIEMKGPTILNNTRRVRGYAGMVKFSRSRLGFKFEYKLNGLENNKAANYQNGLQYQVILHELVHAATVAQTYGLPITDPRIKELENLRKEIKQKFIEDLRQKKFDRSKDRDKIFNIDYALKNIDEFMAQGLSDADTQKYLKDIQVSKNFSSFGKLVDIARRILGLPKDTTSGLEALLNISDKLLSSSLIELDKDLQTGGKTQIAKLFKEAEGDKELISIDLASAQPDLFGEDAKTLNQINEELPKAKKKLPPGRSPELAAMAEQLQAGQLTKEEYDAAVNKYRPIPVYTEPLQPATDEQVVNALYSNQQPKANISIPTGTKVGLRLDIPAWNRKKTFVVAIHEPRKSMTSGGAGLALGYRSVAMAKNVTFGLGNQEKALEIAVGAGKDALQTMEGEYINVSPEEAYQMAQRAIKDPRYVQLGFDPVRHSYFFDRATTLPVIKAEEVLQIGNMILARGVEYGSKQNFLYNIDSQSSLFGNDEAKALKQAEGTLPDFKVVTKGRSPELTEAADKLRKGEITKEEYDAAVKKYSPVTLYAEPPKPPSDQKIEEALDKNKRPYANLDVDNGTKVGLRLDIPAWENKQTWVVAIHAPKPTLTSPKASEILSYRSAAKLKNVKFGVGNQAKTLRIAAGEFKDKLQTMEGEYVSISPEDAYKQAQELIKDPAYIQIGFNPTRHAYFYDRNTMTPVVSADEVLQIGNFILAKGAKFGSKSDFLFDIDRYPQLTEEQLDADMVQTREEKIDEYTRLRAKRSQLVKQYIAQGPSIDLQRNLALTDQLAKDLKEDIDASAEPSLSPENFLRRALDAYEKGDLSPDVLATIRDAYVKTPWVLNGIRLSIRKPKEDRSSGNFQPFARVVTLWNGTSGIEDPSTVRHEIMHSLEQMMTVPQKKIILDEWRSAFDAAVKKNKDPQSQVFFKNVIEFLDTPSDSSFAAAVQSMPSYDYYQYLSPSEYWAINAEKLFAAKLGTQWERFKSAVRKLVESMKKVFGFDNRLGVHKVFDRLMKDQPERMSYPMLADFVMSTGARAMVPQNVSQNIFGQPMPKATWGSPDESKIDDILYVLQDKNIDTKRVVQAITQQRKGLVDKWNPYLQEELYHGRTAKQTDDFLKKELEPLMNALRDRGLTMDQVEEYLHNRHAEERNIQNAKRDPNMPDGGSGILTADAQAYLAGLNPKQKKDFEDIAKMVDKIVQGTQDLIVSSGQEKQGVIDNWNNAYKNYVPLNREEADYDVKNVGVGVGSGIAIKGPFSRASVGSGRKVVDILANVAMQRERAIIRAEKIRVGKAVYSLAVTNPNPGFWLPYDPYVKKDPLQLMSDLVSMGIDPADAQNIVDEPTSRKVDLATNTVKETPNKLLISGALSLPVRINGEEKFIIFNSNDPRAVRMVEALKNLDVDQLSKALGVTQMFTQYFAKINTQYNPVFGVINFTRDVQAAMLQLSTTPIAGKKKQVLAGVGPALRGIYGEERAKRKGQPPTNRPWAQLWEEFQQEGGQTGFRDMFSRSQERAEALQRILDPSSWTKSPLGKVFTAGGTLKVPAEIARKAATPLFDWLSDYNQTMENAVRLSAYKVALDQGMTKQQAASIAKNLTVNFNRKGQIGRQMGALYAFFNASVQGTARMYQTLTGPAGKMIIGGGLLLGSAQAMLLAAAGFDEDEPPDFVKERNIVLPIGDSKYVTIPMPLGYNVIPNTSRIVTEWFLSGFKDTHKRIGNIFEATLDMFNPIGHAGWSAQTITPTVLDPVVALTENRDWTGKPIAKEDISSLDPTPGYTRARETASIVGKGLSEFLNYASGGTKYTPGELSPTPDQIDYLIGQFTGGIGRELMKAEQTVRSQITGEDLPIYKVPLVGRFVGDSQGLAAERNRFYNNIMQLNKHEREIKGRRANRENVQEYLMDNPDARLFNYANQVERNIQTLRKRRDILLEKGAPKEQVKVLENQIGAQMKRFNDRVAETQR
jgi:hypothetical protein